MQLVFWDGAHHSGLEEGGPLPLQGPLTPPVILHTVDNRSFAKFKEWLENSVAAWAFWLKLSYGSSGW